MISIATAPAHSARGERSPSAPEACTRSAVRVDQTPFRGVKPTEMALGEPVGLAALDPLYKNRLGHALALSDSPSFTFPEHKDQIPMYHTHTFARPETLSRAQSWLTQLGFHARQAETSTGASRLVIVEDPQRMAAARMLINAAENTDPKGFNAFWVSKP